MDYLGKSEIVWVGEIVFISSKYAQLHNLDILTQNTISLETPLLIKLSILEKWEKVNSWS